MEIYQTEEQQVEAIKGFWKENGNMVIAGIVIGFAGFIGFNLYKENQLAQEMAISDSYQTMMESMGKNEQAFNASANAFIKDNGQTSYATLTALALAKETASHKDWTETQKHLENAISHAPNEGLKNIAMIRLARVQIELEQYEQALATLANPFSESFTATVEETKGDIYLLQGKKELARNAYQVAIAADGLATSPLLQMKVDDLAQITNLNAAIEAPTADTSSDH